MSSSVLHLGEEGPILDQVAEADCLVLGITILLPEKYIPFFVQHELPEGVLKLKQPLHTDEDSAKATNTPQQHDQASELSQNTYSVGCRGSGHS